MPPGSARNTARNSWLCFGPGVTYLLRSCCCPQTMSEDDLAQVKNGLSLEREVSKAASDYKDESSSLRNGRCTHPVHGHTSDDGNARNMIVTDDGWYCYSHGTGGSVIDWVAVEEGIINCSDAPVDGDDFYDALQAAADRAGVELSGGTAPEDYEEAQSRETLSDEEKAEYALDEAVDILHDNLSTLIGDMSVRGHIKQQRPFDDEMIDHARVGYIDESVRAELLRHLSHDALEDVGIHRDNGSLHTRNRIVYPYTHNGRARFWIARKTEESSQAHAKYLKPASESTVLEEPIYRYDPVDGANRTGVWVTEGIQDAIALGEHAEIRAVSPVATNPSPKQKEQLFEEGRNATEMVVCFDDDAGGHGEAVELILDLLRAGVDAKLARLGDGYDPCDYFAEGNDFEDIEVVSAARAVIEEKGETEAVVRRLFDTVEEDTFRAEQLLNEVQDITGSKKSVLRDLLAEESEIEEQTPFRPPTAVMKKGRVDHTFIFEWEDGERIELESLAGQRSHLNFCDKYAAKFNYIPDITRSEFRDMANEWLADTEKRAANPLSDEEQARAEVLRRQASGRAYEDKADAGSVDEATLFYEGEDTLWVNNDAIREWTEDYPFSLKKLSNILEDLLAGPSEGHMIAGERARYWQFSVPEVEAVGYGTPDTVNIEEPQPEEDVEGGDSAL